MKNKRRVVLAGIITALVISGLLLFASILLTKGKTSEMILPGGILLIIVIFMIPFVKRRYFDVKKGFPYEDERTKKVMVNAAAKAYYISLYWLLAISFSVEVLEIIELDVGGAIGTGIVGMAIIFGICYWYFNRKGDVE